jgi:hypothetical protein
MAGPGLQEYPSVGGILAGDVASYLARGVHQVPDVLELEDSFHLGLYIHFAEVHGPGKVLNVDGS